LVLPFVKNHGSRSPFTFFTRFHTCIGLQRHRIIICHASLHLCISLSLSVFPVCGLVLRIVACWLCCVRGSLLQQPLGAVESRRWLGPPHSQQRPDGLPNGIRRSLTRDTQICKQTQIIHFAPDNLDRDVPTRNMMQFRKYWLEPRTWKCS